MAFIKNLDSCKIPTNIVFSIQELYKIKKALNKKDDKDLINRIDVYLEDVLKIQKYNKCYYNDNEYIKLINKNEKSE